MDLFSFCGLDQSGKTTIINKVKEKLGNGVFYYTKEPRIFTSDKIKKIIVPSKLNFLFFLIDRLLHKLKLFKHRNKIIISDRSIVCGIAYAYATKYKFNFHITKFYCNFKKIIPVPHIVFYIVPEFQAENKEFNNTFRTNVKEGYEKVAFSLFPDTVIVKLHNKQDQVEDCINKAIEIITKFK